MNPNQLLPFANAHIKGNLPLTLPTCLVLLLLFLPACATTNPPLQYTPIPSRASLEPPEDQEKKLNALPFEELLNRGSQYLAGGNTKLARLHFQMALKKKSDSADAYAGLGEALANDNEIKAAHQMLSKALAIDTKHRQALLTTGKLYQSAADFEQAKIYFTRALENCPTDSEILTELAITYGHLGQEKRAENLLVQVVSQKPQDQSAHNNLGFIYLLQGMYPEAIKTLETALTIKPGATRVQYNLAAAYAMNNEPQKAFDLLSRIAGKAVAYNDLGYFYMIQGKKDPAKDAFEKAMTLNPRYYVRAEENLRRLEDNL